MKGKRKLGLGCTVSRTTRKRSKNQRKKRNKIRKISFGGGIVSKVRNTLRKTNREPVALKDLRTTARFALQAARRYLKSAGGKRHVRTPRIIPIPKVGGILPLIPIFAGLSALGSLAGTAAGIAKAVNTVKASREQLAEANRHNRHMEAIAMGKKGSGMYLKPYRKGLGLYLNPHKSKNY